jgi:hypothetical protein
MADWVWRGFWPFVRWAAMCANGLFWYAGMAGAACIMYGPNCYVKLSRVFAVQGLLGTSMFIGHYAALPLPPVRSDPHWPHSHAITQQPRNQPTPPDVMHPIAPRRRPLGVPSDPFLGPFGAPGSTRGPLKGAPAGRGCGCAPPKPPHCGLCFPPRPRPFLGNAAPPRPPARSVGSNNQISCESARFGFFSSFLNGTSVLKMEY